MRPGHSEITAGFPRTLGEFQSLRGQCLQAKSHEERRTRAEVCLNKILRSLGLSTEGDVPKKAGRLQLATG